MTRPPSAAPIEYLWLRPLPRKLLLLRALHPLRHLRVLVEEGWGRRTSVEVEWDLSTANEHVSRVTHQLFFLKRKK